MWVRSVLIVSLLFLVSLVCSVSHTHHTKTSVLGYFCCHILPIMKTLRIINVTDSFSRCFEILELGFVVYCCAKIQCEPWRLYEHIYLECFEFGFKHCNVRRMRVPLHGSLLAREKKHCKTDLFIGTSCGFLILFPQPPPSHGAFSSQAGWDG